MKLIGGGIKKEMRNLKKRKNNYKTRTFNHVPVGE